MRIVVVGGGASGMISAIYSARAGADVILLEKMKNWAKRYTSPEKVDAMSPMTVRLMISFKM